MQQLDAAAAPPAAAMAGAVAVDDPRAFARGVVIGSVLSAPAWLVFAFVVQALLD